MRVLGDISRLGVKHQPEKEALMKGDLPKNAAGKVLKRMLHEQHWNNWMRSV